MDTTVQLRKLLEQNFNPFGDYPIFSEEYRKTLEDKIKNHYYFREIGQETPAKFKHYLTAKMNEIMPYYNHMYESELLYFADSNPFDTYNLTETLTREGTSTSKLNASNTSKLLALLSETPQGAIDINSNDYVSNVSKNDGEGTSTQTGEGSNSESYTLTRKGNIGVQTIGYEMKQYREAFLRIDEDIIKEVGDCFLMFYE